MVAGVCAAFGRATNTDPVLWRVVLGVLTIFGGAGIAIYLLGWILLPADGDTATPVEAVARRGRSATSTIITILAVIFIVGALGAFFDARRPAILGVLLIGAVFLLLLRDQRGGQPGATSAPPPPSGGPMQSAPFAPHGPYAGSGAYSSATSTLPPVPPVPPVGQPMRAPRPPRERSYLGRLTLSLLLVVIGVLALADISGRNVTAGVYLAAALGTIGLALLVGAWYGRARGLIALGIGLAVALSAVGSDGRFGNWRSIGDETWQPMSVNEISDTYEHGVGNAQLDLTSVDFTNRSVVINVSVRAGDLTVTLPPTVDVTVHASIDVGNADVFDQHWDGVGLHPRTVTDNGTDGVGGGTLILNANVNVGNLEVTR
jgi:phage shock protein PspC (stress-responsive transcriptional regulator)